MEPSKKTPWGGGINIPKRGQTGQPDSPTENLKPTPAPAPATTHEAASPILATAPAEVLPPKADSVVAPEAIAVITTPVAKAAPTSGRKRGRPSKADLRAQQSAGTGKRYINIGVSNELFGKLLILAGHETAAGKPTTVPDLVFNLIVQATKGV